MNKPRLMLLAGAVVLVVAGAVTLMLMTGDSAPVVSPSSSGVPAAAGSPRADTAPSGASTAGRGEAIAATDPPIEAKPTLAVPLPADLPPMPATDLPLAAQLEALVARTKAGDGDAACRLAIQVEQCQFQPRRQLIADLLATGASRFEHGTGRDVLIDKAARIAEDAERFAAFCDAVDPPVLRDAGEAVAAQLDRLNVRQKVVLAMLKADGQLARLSASPPAPGTASTGEELVSQFYSDHMESLLLAGLAARDPLALEGLVMFHVPVNTLSSRSGIRFTEPDQYRFALYARTSLELNGAMGIGPYLPQILDRVFEQMTADTRMRLEREVSALVAEFRAAQHLQKSAPKSADAGFAELCAD